MLRFCGFDTEHRAIQAFTFDYLKSSPMGVALYVNDWCHPVAVIEETYAGTSARRYRILLYNRHECIDTRTEKWVAAWDIREVFK